MLSVHRNCSLVIYRTYAKWLKRKAVRVLTSEESEQFHSSRRKSPAPNHCTEAETVEKTAVSAGNQKNVKFETLHVGDSRFGYMLSVLCIEYVNNTAV